MLKEENKKCENEKCHDFMTSQPNNCGLYVSIENCNRITRKYEKMDKIPVPEEQAREMLRNCLSLHPENGLDIESTILNMKDECYIKQSALEIAKEKWEKDCRHSTINTVVPEMYIDELEKEIERLNK